MTRLYTALVSTLHRQHVAVINNMSSLCHFHLIILSSPVNNIHHQFDVFQYKDQL